MDPEKQSRIEQLRSELADLESTADTETAEVIEEAVEEARDVVEEAVEAAAEGAETVEEAAEQIEAAVEAVAEEAARDSPLTVEEIYEYIMGRLHEEGHLRHTHEGDGPAEAAAEIEQEVLDTAPIQPEDAGLAAVPPPPADAAPEPEHWFYRPRLRRRTAA